MRWWQTVWLGWLIVQGLTCPAQVLHLDGIGSYVELPERLGEDAMELTLEIRAQWDHFLYFEAPLHFGDDLHGLGFNHNAVEHRVPKVFVMPGIRTAYQLNGGQILNQNEWIHLAATFSTNGFRFYVNGVCLGTNNTPLPPGLLQHAPARWLGRSPWPDNGYFRGDLDDVAIWSRTLSDTEIKDRVHQPLTGTEPGLIAAWTFDAPDPTNDRVVLSIGPQRLPARLQRQAKIAPSSSRVVARFPPPSFIHGRVTNSRGRPDPSVVRLWQGSRVIQATKADETGSFRFNLLVPAGDYELEATSTDEGTWSPVHVQAGTNQSSQLSLQPRVSVKGTLTTMLNRAQSGVEIQAWRKVPASDSPNGLILAGLTITDREGQYQFVNLRPGSYQILCVRPTLPGFSSPAEQAQVSGEVSNSTNTLVANFRLPRLASSHSWRRYNLKDGLPDSEVHAILPTPEGSLWVGTGAGLARLDSNGFTVWTRKDGLPSDTVTALTLDDQGTLWVGTSQGVCSWLDGRFIPQSSPSAPQTWINSLTHTKDRTLWAATETGLARWSGGAWNWLGPESGLPDRLVRGVWGQPDGSLLIRSSTRYLRLQGQKLEFWPADRPLPGMPSQMPTWWSLESRTDLEFPSSLMWASQGSGSTWSAFQGRLDHFQERWFQIPWEDEARPIEILSLGLDSRGSLWLGTRTQGLWRFQTDLPETINDADGLPGRIVRNSALTPDGTVWIGCEGGLASWKRGELKIWNGAQGLAGRRILALKTDQSGTLWVSTELGLFRREESRFVAVRNFTANSVGGISESTDGQIWLATSGNGVLRGSERGWTRFGLERGVAHDFTVSVLPARDGTVWINFDQALFRLKRDATDVVFLAPPQISAEPVVVITNLAGFPPDRGQFLEASELAESPDGTLWCGSFRHGLLRHRVGVWTHFGTADGLPSIRVQAVHVAPDGRTWCGTPRGASVFDGELWSTLDSEDGLAGDSVNHIRSDPDGSLWFATSAGLTRYRPGRITPTVRLRSVEGDEVHQFLNDLPVFPAAAVVRVVAQTDGRNRLRWRVSGPGANGLWSTLSASPSFSFRPETPGDYTLEVMAVDRDLNRSQPALVQLTVVWPWFRNPWILTPLAGGAALSMAGMGWFAWRNRKNRQESARLRQEALARAEQDRLGAEFARQLIRTQEAERSRLAHELHDSLGQELLLIRNTALLAGNGHGGGAGNGGDRSGPLTDIAERASRTIEELRNIAYALRPQELDRLGLVRALKVLCEEMAEAGGLILNFSADSLNGPLPPEMEISLYRVVQEALSNVVHHARATTLNLRLSTSEDRLRITLRDNGIGFDTSGRSSESTSLGLVGMAERIRLLGGGFSLTSRPQEGTVVDFWLPLQRPRSPEHPPNS